jgi:hypothetical protein
MDNNYSVDQDLEEMFKELEKPSTDNSIPTTLYLLTVMTESLRDLDLYFDAFISNPKGEEGFKYLQSSGYIFTMSRLEDESATPKEYLPGIFALNKLSVIYSDLKRKYRNNPSILIRSRVRDCVESMLKISLNLWLNEVEQFKEKLLSIEEAKLDAYIVFILDHQDNKYKKENVEFFKSLMKEHLR